MLEGWISLHRKIKEHWLWKDPVKFQWWIDILLSVNHSDNKVNIGNQLYDCKRGQSVKSLQTWAEQFKTSKDNARNFLKLLEKDNMITMENIVKSTRLTVCNYDSYNGGLHATPTQRQRTTNATPTEPHTNNNENNVKNENNENKLVLPFNSLLFVDAWNRWKTYKREQYKFTYKSISSEQQALTQLANQASNQEARAIEIINWSIGQSYKGLYPPKQFSTTPDNKTQYYTFI